MHPILLLSLLACDGSDAANGGDDSNGADTAGGDTAADTTRTLDTCGGTIEDDVPTFYARYFHCVDIWMNGADVMIRTQNLPPHPSYYWGEASPNYVAWDDRGGQYHPNPNTLGQQDWTFTIPADPVSKGLTITSDLVDYTAQTSPDEYALGPAGVALDSVGLFNDEAAPGDDILDERWTFDPYEAHPAETEYHYHGYTPGPLEVMATLGLTTSTTPGAADIELYGVMCDGTVALGCTELDGSAVEGELDAQNGHVGDIVDADGTAYFTGRYHVHVCEALGDYGLTPEIQYYDTCLVLR
jgi:hypothetical protein